MLYPHVLYMQYLWEGTGPFGQLLFPCQYRELNLGQLQEQEVLSTAEPLLEPKQIF